MKLGEVIELGLSKKIKIENAQEYVIAGVQSYGKGVVNRRKELGKDMKMKEYQKIENGFLMWCKVDTKNGAFGITKDEHVGSLASTNMCLAKINTEKIYSDFLERLFRFDFFHSYITHLSSGTTNRKYLTPTQLCQMVELPNLTIEQQKGFLDLAEQIENNELKSELIHQEDLLKQLRQAFLREAMQGKLVEQNSKDGNASDLLKKIKEEKLKSGKKEKELPPIKEEEIPFDIPKNWVWCRLGEITDELLGGFAFDSTRYSKTETSNQIIRLGNVKINQVVLETNPVFIDDEYSKEAAKAKLKEGDILITMTGTRKKRDYLFTLCMNENDFATKNLFLNQRVGCFRFSKLLSNEFLNFVLKDSRLLEPVFLSSTGAANQANIGITALKEILIPLPPFAEQKRIVNKLEEVMNLCEELKTTITDNQNYTNQLLQVALKDALQMKEVEVEN